MKYIVYKTTCLVNNKIYVGVHKTENPDIFDGYLGNSLWVNRTDKIKNPQYAFHFAVKKYGVNNFKRETLYVFDTEEEAYQKESEIVTLKFIQSDKTYNVALGGKKGTKSPKPVYQFDLSGNLLNTFEYGMIEAAKSLDGTWTCIQDAIKFKHKSYGFLWSFDMVIDLNEYNIISQNNYYIYDSDGTFINEFNTAKECIEFLQTNSANLSRAVKSKIKVNGYFITTEKLDNYQVLVSKSSEKLNRYSISGEYIDSFNTISEAKQKLGLKLSSISTAIKMNRTCNGYRWTRSNNPSKFIEVTNNINTPRKVEMYDKNGVFIKTFDTVSQADKEYPGCRSVLKGSSKTSHGYIFKYK